MEGTGRRRSARLQLLRRPGVVEEKNKIMGFGRLHWGLEQTADFREQDMHLATVVETLQSIKQSEMSPMLSRIYGAEGGPETLDVLMKYLYAVSPATPRSSFILSLTYISIS